MMFGRRTSGADFPCAANPAATASDAVRAKKSENAHVWDTTTGAPNG